MHYYIFSFFFFNDTATTEIYTLSLHDALPIWHLARLDVEEAGDVLHHEGLIEPGLECLGVGHEAREKLLGVERREDVVEVVRADRKRTRLNSSHLLISYAVFCL